MVNYLFKATLRNSLSLLPLVVDKQSCLLPVLFCGQFVHLLINLTELVRLDTSFKNQHQWIGKIACYSQLSLSARAIECKPSDTYPVHLQALVQSVSCFFFYSSDKSLLGFFGGSAMAFMFVLVLFYIYFYTFLMSVWSEISEWC